MARNRAVSDADAEPIGDVSDELRKIRDELRRVRLSRLRDRIIGAIVVALLVGFVVDNRLDNARQDRTDKTIAANDKAGQDRTLGALVGSCAVGNVDRINERNRLIDVSKSMPYVLTPAFPAYLERQLKTFQNVDCRAFVPAKDQVKLCLQYPPDVDPATGKPIPTTTTPIDKKACSN